MRIETIKIYTFEELSDEAQQVAIQNHRQNQDHSWLYEEAKATVKEFCRLFNVTTGHRSWLEVGSIDGPEQELKGLRLRKWILNNFGDVLWKRKFINSFGDNKVVKHPCVKVNRYTNPGRRVDTSNYYYSRIQFDNSCVLTGMCYDDSMLQPIYSFIEYVDADQSATWSEIVADCFSSLKSDLESEVEAREQDDYIREELQECLYEFTENGHIY